MFIFWSIIVGVLMFSVVAVIRAKQVSAPTPAHTATTVPSTVVPYTYVVLPGSTLSVDELQSVFALLVTARDAYVANPDIPKSRQVWTLDTYVYQLTTSKTSAGDTLVYVYAGPLHMQDSADWGRVLLNTRDGGAEYFDVTVNLTARTTVDFIVHGEA